MDDPTRPEISFLVEGTVPDSISGITDIKAEDGGACLVAYGTKWENEKGGDGCFYVQLVSWDEEAKAHPLMKSLMGRRIELSIRTVD